MIRWVDRVRHGSLYHGGAGTAASRPAAGVAGSGAYYLATDTNVLSLSNGSSWSTISAIQWARFLNDDAGVIYVHIGSVWVQEATGGGSSPILTATVTLTHAQILTLPTTPVEIVAAPGAGKAAVLIQGFVHADTVVGYTYDDTAKLRLVYGNDDTDAATPIVKEVLFEEAHPGGWYVHVLPPMGTGANVGAPIFFPQDSVTYLDNAAISLLADNGGAGNFTGGDAANTLKVTVLYAVLDLA